MKKRLLVAIVILSCIFSGCGNNYDYRTDTPLGVYQLQMPDSAPDADVYSDWIGDVQIVSTAKQTYEELNYNDGNIAIVACEERLDCCILTVYYSGCGVLSNATFSFDCFEDDKCLGEATSESQMLIGGLYSSVIIKVPSGTNALALKQYSATFEGKLERVSFYEFSSNSMVEHSSITTYHFKKETNVILCTEDGRIVYGCMNQPKGKTTIGRNFVTKFGIVEVE